ncbi:MAG: hypothetical protein Q8J80_00500 [Gallionella sp.]|nr:hypothetical protein [Gallionella sp.]
MNRLNFLSLPWVFLLSIGLSGCGGTIKKAEYPSTWPSRATYSVKTDCQDISGTYKASNGEQLLPFFLFGILDTTSLDWANLVQINEQLLAKPDGATVAIGTPDSDHIEVMVAIYGTPIAKQVLTRSRQSADAAELWFGQREQSFRCERDGIVIVGTYIHNWSEYRLSNEEKKRRYRRPGKNDVGTSRGYFDFSKTIDGRLIMRQRLFFCLGCGGIDELWRRWEPALGATAK